jgi:spore coat protein A, manganese oxidase
MKFNKKFTRRQFLKGSMMAGAYLAAGGAGALFKPGKAHAFATSPSLKKFIQPLRNPLTGGIPLAASEGVKSFTSPYALAGSWRASHYTIDIGQFEDQLHPNLPNTTRLWGYGQNFSATDSGWTKHLGGIIVAEKGKPVQITFQNRLTRNGTPTGAPRANIIPVDTSIPGANQAQNRTAVHLHGGFIPWVSDGGPFDWWAPDGTHGASFLNNAVLNPGASLNQAEYYYPNNQSARLVWYHDHAHGITRTNAYAGVASAYVITDSYEAQLVSANYLPGPLDPRTLYLVFQDKVFYNEANDPAYAGLVQSGAKRGDLWYAHTYDTSRWDRDITKPAPPDPSVVPEFFGDTILCNGTVYPYVQVEKRQYRFRMLNACNARFLNPKLYYAKGASFPDSTEINTLKEGPAFIQFGTEGGFSPTPVMLNGPKQLRLVMAPAERGDFIVDFRDVPAGSVLILYSNAPGPYPSGDPRTDFYPGNPQTPTAAPGYGPNTRTLLQFQVVDRVGPADPQISLPSTLTPTDPFILTQTPGVVTPIPTSIGGQPVGFRRLTLNEDFDSYGRLIQYLGTDVVTSTPPPLFGREYTSSPATEVVSSGAYEVWEILNLTGDVHPIHFHLVNVQILSRQRFDAVNYSGGAPRYTAAAIAPDANELGWKETVRMNPGQVIRVFMKFDLPAVPFTIPTSPRSASMGLNTRKTNHEYVWHCHILEHEEHDMMRPLVVTEP